MITAWPTQDWDGFVGRWRAACAEDAVLRAFAGGWSVCFAIASGNAQAVFNFVDGRIAADGPAPEFGVAAPASIWEKFLLPVPPRHHHVVLAMLARLPEVTLQGDALAFAQHCHVVRRVLELGKWLVLGNDMPAPASLRPRLPPSPPGATTGVALEVPIGGIPHSMFYEHAGQGQDILCLHTAGSDLRQFHRLMANPALTARHRLVAFDLPWHGRSAPSPGGIPGGWKMTTDFYVETIMAFVAAAGLVKPIVLGASMSGEICLELALRHPEAFRAIVACEACDHVAGRQTGWSWHPQVNQAVFVPEWIHGLMAPQSPAQCADEILWQYGQGGPGVFAGDIHFYSGEWDARDRVHRIDTSRCKLYMLTGEYDYSCTAEMSQATAEKIPGVRFQRMNGIGHFPFAENPELFAQYLLPILDEVSALD